MALIVGAPGIPSLPASLTPDTSSARRLPEAVC